MMSGIESKYITEDGMKVPPTERDCVTRSERKPKSLLAYTKVNCMAECRTQKVLEVCKCVPYFLPNNGKLLMKLLQINRRFNFT